MKHPHNYRTHYIKENQVAALACAELLEISREGDFMGLDIETTYREGYEGTKLAGLDPYRSRIRLIQIACEQTGAVHIFDMFHVDFKVLHSLLTKGKFFAHSAFFEHQHLSLITNDKELSDKSSLLQSEVW